MIFVLLMIFIGIILFEVPEMIRGEDWHELKIFSLFLIVAFTMSVLYTLGISIPNPIKGMEYVVKDLLHLNYK